MGRIDYIDDTIAPRPGEPSIATAAHFEWGRASRSRRHAAIDGGPNVFNALREQMSAPHGANALGEPVQQAGKHVHETAAYLRDAVAHVHPAVAYGHEDAEHVHEAAEHVHEAAEHLHEAAEHAHETAEHVHGAAERRDTWRSHYLAAII